MPAKTPPRHRLNAGEKVPGTWIPHLVWLPGESRPPRKPQQDRLNYAGIPMNPAGLPISIRDPDRIRAICVRKMSSSANRCETGRSAQILRIVKWLNRAVLSTFYRSLEDPPQSRYNYAD